MTPEYAQEHVDRDGERIGLHVYPEPEHPEPEHPEPEYPEPDKAGRETAPIVVIFPAMGVPARFYRPLARGLRLAGLAVVVIDLRGTGASTPAPSWRSGYGYTELTSDVGAVLDALKPRLDRRRVFLLGHSLGGQVCALHLARTGDDRIDGLILVAVGLPWYRCYPRRRRGGVLLFSQGIVAVASVLRVWPGWGFGGRQARGVIRDWGFTARHGRFPVIGGHDAEAALSRLRTPVLALSAEADLFTPAMTVDHLCAKLTSSPIDRVHLADTTLDHFSWVRSPAPVITAVTRFVGDR
jgi:predicted alpha/beta hydrolase